MVDPTHNAVEAELIEKPLAEIPRAANTADIDDAITRPGAVRINVRGAFILNEGTITPATENPDGSVHDTAEIRLPHHTAVVSHVAVDVRCGLSSTRSRIDC